jgi:hypothetical protein
MERMMPAKRDTFKAVMEATADYKKKLRASGDVTEPTTGWTVTLERANPQGINPAILLLTINAVAPSGEAEDIVTTHPVRFEEDPAKVDYTQVTVQDGSNSFTINVTPA